MGGLLDGYFSQNNNFFAEYNWNSDCNMPTKETVAG